MTAFDRLKKLCDEQGISVNKLEEKIGLGKNTLYSWKKNTPKGSNLIKVSDYFNVSTDYLLGREVEEIDPEVRSLARDIQSFDPANRALLNDIIKSMKQRGKKALDE